MELLPEAPQAYYQTPNHVIAAAVALPVLDILAVGLRMGARKRQKQPLKADDWLIVPGMLLTLGIGILMIYSVSKESLAHRMKIPEDFNGNPFELVTDQMSLMAKTQFAYILMLPLTLGCIKLSILFFYFRIFAITRAAKTYWIIAFLCGLTMMWTVAFFLANLLQCGTNVWALWGSTQDLIDNCIPATGLDFALCVTDFVTDVIILLIPIPLIWRGNLSRAKKLSVSIFFLIGSVTIVASMLRLIMMIGIYRQGVDPNLDGILVVTEYLYWGMIECGTGVIAACLPTSQVLIRKLPWGSVYNSLRSGTGLSGSRWSQRNASAHSHGSGGSGTGRAGSDHKKYVGPPGAGLHYPPLPIHQKGLDGTTVAEDDLEAAHPYASWKQKEGSTYSGHSNRSAARGI